MAFHSVTRALAAVITTGAALACGSSGAAAASSVPAASAGAVVLSITYSPGGGPIFTNATTSTASLTGSYAGTIADAGTTHHFEGTVALIGSGSGSASTSQGFDEYGVQMAGTSVDGSTISCSAAELSLYLYRLPGGIAFAGLQGTCRLDGVSAFVSSAIVGIWAPTNPGAGVTTPETTVLVTGAAGGW
jgi:hypothetical protein